MTREEFAAAMAEFASLGARGPAVLEITQSDFDRLRNECLGKPMPDVVYLDFQTPIGTVTVQARADTVTDVPRFVLVERFTGRQHAIVDVEIRQPPRHMPAAAKPTKYDLN